MSFEKLNLPFVPLRGGDRIKSAEIAALAGRGVYLPRIKAVFARFEFPCHKFFQRDILVRATFRPAAESPA